MHNHMFSHQKPVTYVYSHEKAWHTLLAAEKTYKYFACLSTLLKINKKYICNKSFLCLLQENNMKKVIFQSGQRKQECIMLILYKKSTEILSLSLSLFLSLLTETLLLLEYNHNCPLPNGQTRRLHSAIVFLAVSYYVTQPILLLEYNHNCPMDRQGGFTLLLYSQLFPIM